MSYLLTDNGTAVIANNVIRYNNYEEKFEKDLADYGLKIVHQEVLKNTNTSHKLVII